MRVGRRGAEVRNRPVADVGERARLERRRDDRRPVRTSAATRSRCAPARGRLGHRDDDEVRDKQAIRVEVAGGDGGILMRADDDDRPVGSNRRQCGATPVEDDEVGIERSATRAPSSTFDVATPPASPPPHRRQPTVATPTRAAVSRWSDAAWRPERESSTSASTVGGTVMTSGSGGPPLPIATTTTRGRPRAGARDGR